MSNRQREQLTIREVTRENWQDALRMAVHPEQQRFIAEVVPIAAIALAKAYIRPGGLLWLPYAFYAGTEMIGFTTLACDPDSSDNYWIFHFFIDKEYQGQGYGKQALRLFLVSWTSFILFFVPPQYKRTSLQSWSFYIGDKQRLNPHHLNQLFNRVR